MLTFWKFFLFSFSLNVQLIVYSKKVFIMFDIEYLQNFIFRKIKVLKYFKNQIFFHFKIDNSRLTENALDVYFPSQS